MTNPKRRVVTVEWEDAHANSRWMTPEEALYNMREPQTVTSIGFLVDQGPSGIVLACSVSKEGWFGNLQRIPKAMIRKVRR